MSEGLPSECGFPFRTYTDPLDRHACRFLDALYIVLSVFREFFEGTYFTDVLAPAWDRLENGFDFFQAVRVYIRVPHRITAQFITRTHFNFIQSAQDVQFGKAQ